MPKYRQLHVKIIDSFDFNEMPDDFTRLTWTLLMLVVDSEGRGIDKMAWVRSKMYPLRDDVTIEQLEAAFAFYESRQMIGRYEANGNKYFFVTNWKDYQTGTDREAKSNFPDPSAPTPEPLPSSSRVAPAQYNADADSNADADADADASDADNAWLPLSKAFTAATGIPELTGGPAAFYKAVEEMARAGVIPADITAAVGEMREKGFSIASIRSVVNPAIIAMSRRTHPGNGRGRDAPKGWQDPDQPSPEEVLKLLESDT